MIPRSRLILPARAESESPIPQFYLVTIFLMTLHRAETRFHYCPTTNKFFFTVRTRETHHPLLELNFTRDQFQVLINSAIFEYEDSQGEPFPISSEFYVQDEQEEGPQA